ncbi:MAG: heme ABC transporter ATP-binding protein [Kiloniellales bacterium]
MLSARDLDFGYGGRPVLVSVSLTVAPGEVVAVLGPNGVGKSTLLALLSGAYRPQRGAVELDSLPLVDWGPEALARRRAVLAQRSELPFPFTVIEVVTLGRAPHAGRSRRSRDLALVGLALGETRLSGLAGRDYTALSGGERQRVQLARALAQIGYGDGEGSLAGRYLLLDEPTSGLDLSHQHACLATAVKAARDGAGVLAILHDPNLAARYADRIALMNGGRIVAEGAPEAVLTEERLSRVFDLPLRVGRHPTRDCPHVVAA